MIVHHFPQQNISPPTVISQLTENNDSSDMMSFMTRKGDDPRPDINHINLLIFSFNSSTPTSCTSNVDGLALQGGNQIFNNGQTLRINVKGLYNYINAISGMASPNGTYCMKIRAEDDETLADYVFETEPDVELPTINVVCSTSTQTCIPQQPIPTVEAYVEP